MKIVEEFIAEIRKFGISKLSRMSGISRTTITKWLSGESSPTLVHAQQCADAMGLEFLLFDKLED